MFRHIPACSRLYKRFSCLNEARRLFSSGDAAVSSVHGAPQFTMPSGQLLESLPAKDQSELNSLVSEFEVHFYMGRKVPSKMNDKRWTEALRANPFHRASLYKYWFLKDKRLDSHQVTRNERAEALERLMKERQEKIDAGHYVNNCFTNTLFQRINKTCMTENKNWRLASSLQFGLPLVLDMGYEQHMDSQCIRATVKQLSAILGVHRNSVDPFHLYLCSLNPNGTIVKQSFKQWKTFHGHPIYDRLITTTRRSYLELFPRDRLVYLTPHTVSPRDVLHQFDPNDIYIIGCYVDLFKSKPISLARAREQKIRMARLPLDYHVKWRKGTKNLSLLSVFSIMDSAKNGMDWEKNLTTHVTPSKFIDMKSWQNDQLQRLQVNKEALPADANINRGNHHWRRT